jgi:hypothetical protein
MYEYELFIPIKHLFNNDYFVEQEIPIGSKRIDVVCAKPKLQIVSGSPHFNEIIAVEVKIKEWRRAVRQALVYQLSAKKVYVAMPHKYASKVQYRVLEKYGVGLISINNGNAQIEKEARNSHYIIRSYQKALENAIINKLFSKEGRDRNYDGY